MKYGHHHHHRRRHREHHKHHISRPLVGSKQYCRITCRQTYEVKSLINISGAWSSAIGFSWQQPRDVGNNALVNFDCLDPRSQFLEEYRNWEEYAITGMRVHYVSAGTGGTVTSSDGGLFQLNGFWSYDDPDSQIPSLNAANILNRKDTVSLPTNRKWSLWKNARPYSAAQNVPWQACDAYDVTAPEPNTLTRAVTMLYIQGCNVNGPLPVTSQLPPFGWITVSWYIVFRG